jgi:hypothetical protein
VLQALHVSGIGGGGALWHPGYLSPCQITVCPAQIETSCNNICSSCQICQQAKTEHVKLPGLLQPLSIPTCVWYMISLDFIEGLPWSQNHNAILVVIDKFSKYAHFLPMTHTLLRCTDCTGYHEPSS